MAYPTYYPGYNPYYNPPAPDQLAALRQNVTPQMMIQQPPQMSMQQAPQVQQQPTAGGIQWVQGEEGAKAWMVAPSASVLLMDSENPSFYIKSSDASGMPLPLRIFDYQERTAQTSQQQAPKPAAPDMSRYITREELEEILADRLKKPAKAAKQKEETDHE